MREQGIVDGKVEELLHGRVWVGIYIRLKLVITTPNWPCVFSTIVHDVVLLFGIVCDGEFRTFFD